MGQHNWRVIVGASRRILDCLRQFRGAVKPHSKSKSVAAMHAESAISHALGGPLSTVQFYFTRDPRDECHRPADGVPGMLYTLYANDVDLRIAALRLWQFYDERLLPRWFEPDAEWEVVDGPTDGDLILKPIYPPRRSLEQRHDDFLALTNLPDSELAEFETAIEQLAAATNVASDPQPDKREDVSGREQPGFVPNNFQAAILRALDGKALTKAALAAEVCGSEGTRLYRKDGIKELMAEGLVKNKPRLGYYRPDRPPAPV